MSGKHIGEIPLTAKALVFAIEKHKDQVRKISGLPYIVHPNAVLAIVYKYKDSNSIDILGACALLHDTLEDTVTTYEELAKEFGGIVANTVREVTNDREEIKRIGKCAYIDEKLATISSYALVIKLADILANLNENPSERAVKRMLHHYCFLMEGSRRILSSTHKKILAEIRYTLVTKYGAENI